MYNYNWVDYFLKPYQTPTDNSSIFDKLVELEARIQELERENVETTNAMYEIANSLESRIDILSSEPYNLSNYTLDK
jgi:hypothetical protein